MKEPATLMHSIRQRLLAHFEKSTPFAPEDPAAEAAPADSGQLLYAPVSGRIRALTRIKDPVFSSEVLGKGCAIEPSCGEVVAPADGIVEKSPRPIMPSVCCATTAWRYSFMLAWTPWS